MTSDNFRRFWTNFTLYRSICFGHFSFWSTLPNQKSDTQNYQTSGSRKFWPSSKCLRGPKENLLSCMPKVFASHKIFLVCMLKFGIIMHIRNRLIYYTYVFTYESNVVEYPSSNNIFLARLNYHTHGRALHGIQCDWNFFLYCYLHDSATIKMLMVWIIGLQFLPKPGLLAS